ncbi:BglG family transcription antiterminator [Virgibacillus oceani]|uniref:Ascorbate-specific PTS system EIIA component n=1 Tax=Virgibacillus oceani TaxID=1479511 RepID=A0A917HBQ3_9BACI|nr:BglG family transcription antiterminator [Virgibacillus oceani]GGG73609.1 PTS sugar transporter subunit IIA [Virgibacillus oceani]
MFLDKRSVSILEELIRNPTISSKDLEVIMYLSRRQIKYSVEKINNWLVDNNYPKIKRLHNGNFLIDSTLMEVFTDSNTITTEHYIPSENERVSLILFILLSQNDLSLFHFTNALKVSNVTVLNDMKQAQKKIEQYGLKIVYTRLDGYQLEGNEWSQRNLLHDIAQEIRNGYAGLSLIQDFTNLHDEKINNISIQLEKIEEILRIKFTDEKIQILPYCIGIIFDRVRRGNIIEFDYQIQYHELSGTKEYEATELLVKNEIDLPEAERLYITLQLLSTNIFSGDLLTQHEMPQLKHVLYETLNHFEINAFMELKNKDSLVQKLMLHLKPAYYRIKYNLTSYTESLVRMDESYLGLDHIVKLSLGPLENFIKSKFPDNERHYLTIFIGGHLLETKQIFTNRKKAMVVCQNGVTVSKMLRNTLTKLFPEFDFYPTMSIREYAETDPVDAAIIFSPVPLKTERNLFIINPLLTEDDKWKLRQRVMKRVYGVDHDKLNIEKLIDVIAKSTTINNEGLLKDDLRKYIQSSYNTESFIKMDTNPNLEDLITKETITIAEEVKDWKDAIKVASKPLLLNNSITENYVNKMIESHNYEHPYMILGKNMAIPHADPEQGVNKLGMSLLIIKKGVPFSDKLTTHFVVVIAPTDADQHVKAIYQLTNLSMNDGVLQKMVTTNEKSEVIKVLKTIEKDVAGNIEEGAI